MLNSRLTRRRWIMIMRMIAVVIVINIPKNNTYIISKCETDGMKLSLIMIIMKIIL